MVAWQRGCMIEGDGFFFLFFLVLVFTVRLQKNLYFLKLGSGSLTADSGSWTVIHVARRRGAAISLFIRG
jgi:hypothetical protein